MNDSIQDLIVRIRALEDRLEDEFAKSRALYQVHLRGRIAEFAEEVIARQKTFKIKWPQYLRAAGFLNVLSAPVIYGMIVPIIFLDAFLWLYQQVCFRAYGIPRVRRRDFIVLDRHHLAYLNVIEKINCLYCGYGNGVFSYAREVAARTEQFWCPIKHAIRLRGPHERYFKFLDYGDAQGYRTRLEEIRRDVQNARDPCEDPTQPCIKEP